MNSEVLSLIKKTMALISQIDEEKEAQKVIEFSKKFEQHLDEVKNLVGSLIQGTVDKSGVAEFEAKATELFEALTLTENMFEEESQLILSSFKDQSYILTDINAETKKALIDTNEITNKIENFIMITGSLQNGSFRYRILNESYDFEKLKKTSSMLREKIGTPEFKPLFLEDLDLLSQIVSLSQKDTKKADETFESIRTKVDSLRKNAREIQESISFD